MQLRPDLGDGPLLNVPARGALEGAGSLAELTGGQSVLLGASTAVLMLMVMAVLGVGIPALATSTASRSQRAWGWCALLAITALPVAALVAACTLPPRESVWVGVLALGALALLLTPVLALLVPGPFQRLAHQFIACRDLAWATVSTRASLFLIPFFAWATVLPLRLVWGGPGQTLDGAPWVYFLCASIIGAVYCWVQWTILVLATARRLRGPDACEGLVEFAHPPAEVDSCVAWKIARLRTQGDAIWLEGVAQGHYRASAEARCDQDGEHLVPDPACTCGFHAWRSRDRAESYLRQLSWKNMPSLVVMLEVELSGDILEYEEGYRAQLQDVLGVHLPACRCGCPAVSCSPRRGQVADFLEASCERCERPGAHSLSALASGLGVEVSPGPAFAPATRAPAAPGSS